MCIRRVLGYRTRVMGRCRESQQSFYNLSFPMSRIPKVHVGNAWEIRRRGQIFADEPHRLKCARALPFVREIICYYGCYGRPIWI